VKTLVNNKTNYIIEIMEGKGKYKVKLVAVKSGKDLTATVAGGEEPHIGAVAIAISRPSLKNPNKLSATSSVFTLVGHKEDKLARRAAEKITKATKETTVTVVGLHINKATSQDIESLVQNTQKAVSKLIEKLCNKKKTGEEDK